jgi:hypothetical protein
MTPLAWRQIPTLERPERLPDAETLSPEAVIRHARMTPADESVIRVQAPASTSARQGRRQLRTRWIGPAVGSWVRRLTRNR